jgi:hypothetical protein
MKYETVVQRIGEDMGPINWSYDFRSHFDCYCTDDAGRDRICAEHVERLRQIAAEPSAWLASTDGGSPKCGYFPVINVCMYDGWPYFRPTPFVRTMGPLGPEWHCFSTITAIMRKPTPKPEVRGTDAA